ncbi:DUF6252 family protein [Winogradskyella sp. PG-2]|uniref:DUF6252 family protein n=1 Tax=Winogradskyella sp. PG-2 TaxID=754409 RepID=UPI0004587F87|nr:DUF6252 family protein [Winogradskyella sp. PG-2]BAO76534.1 hypothetical protein WPG_2304 [Winogradskyella sp. PG-2]
MRAFKNAILCFGYILIALYYSCENEPYDGPLTFDTQLSCSDTSDLVDTALNNFLDSDSSNFADNCLAYKAALEEQLLVCPESFDEISELINDLNNCEFSSFFQVDFDNDTYLSLSAEAHIGNGKLTITGRRDNEDFQIILHQTTEGTYQLGTEGFGGNINTASYFPDVTSNESWVSVSDGNEIMGEVTVSYINYSDLRISGTFNFTGTNNNETKAFTNGIFINIPLTKDDEFFALYDGEEYIDSSILGILIENEMTLVIIIFSEIDSINMDFNIDVNTPPGFYNLRLISELPRAGFSGNDDFYYYGNGTLTITAHYVDAKFILGTFEFIAELENATPESYTITEGRFCINYGL